ncbi:MAG: M48 family metalloprotease [Rhizobiales bacterium]|nr:M48 family metalloprotease [Hyphomicrobiales bacterium]
MDMHLDPERQRAHRKRNFIHTIVIIAAMSLLVGLSAFLLFGWQGVVVALLAVPVVLMLAPRLPSQVIMQLYGARPISGPTGEQLRAILTELAQRAELTAVPRLYAVPSATLNAFATGPRNAPAIALTEGLLRKLSMREIVGVLAHEMSHIRNNDLLLMGLADIMSRITQMMSFAAVALLVWHLPTILFSDERVPWLAILLLYFAPTIASLLQLALSRAREYDADLEAALLTGDPVGLASALERLERYQGHFWEDLVPTGRRIPQPSLLRSHPATADRVNRLRQLAGMPSAPPIVVRDEPMITMVGFGPGQMRPRYRLMGLGLWY